MTPKTLLLAALIAAAPAFAQSAPPAPPAPPQMGHHAGQKGPHGMERGMGMNARMFPSMSEAGRKTMHDAMMAGGNRRDDRQKVEAARDKMLAALEAERFDAGTVKRAMDEERALSDASRQQRQVAMLAAFQKLSAEDRKAFVTDSRAMKARMQGRMEGRREMLRSRMQMRHMGQPSAPPVPPTEG
jgi:hypothetical protein